MKTVEKVALSKFGMDEQGYKEAVESRSSHVIRLRMARREIEVTLDAAFVGILSTDCEGIETNLHTEVLT